MLEGFQAPATVQRNDANNMRFPVLWEFVSPLVVAARALFFLSFDEADVHGVMFVVVFVLVMPLRRIKRKQIFCRV